MLNKATLSALLFILALYHCIDALKKTWHELDLALQIVSGEPLTNLSFADDILLCATSKDDCEMILLDLSDHAGMYGLKLNHEKTQIMTNCVLPLEEMHVSIRCQLGAVLDTSAQDKYLGYKLCACDADFSELRRRLASSWAVFAKFTSKLCSRKIAPKYRVRLFEEVVCA